MVLEKTLEVPWTARRSNQSILKEISPGISLEGMMLKLNAEEMMLLNCGIEDLRVPWTARRSNQSILREINPEYLLDGLMLKLKLQYFGHLM